MTALKKNTIRAPKVEFKVEPAFSTFRVTDGEFYGQEFNFEITSDGAVTINDNTFDSKAQAAVVLRQMADFLSKK